MQSGQDHYSQKSEKASVFITETEAYSIGQTAKLLGTTIKTVRYYDNVGLLSPSNHTEGGHRLYTTEDIQRLQLITTLRFLGFELDDIRKMIAGDLEVASALDLQIESLEAQANKLTNMINILHEAKKHEGDSLPFIHELMNTKSIDSEKRSQSL